MKLLILIIGVLVFGAFADPPTPYWGGNPVWTSRVRVVSHNSTRAPYDMTATYYYNWNLKAQRYDYDENQLDQLCRVSGYPDWQYVKCNVIYSTDGWIYVQFPTSNYCCKCTNAFGGVRYDWLIENSTYAGRKQVYGVTADGWYKYGNPALNLDNYYWVTVGAQRPIKFQEQNNFIYKRVDYDMSTYSTGPIDPSLFAPPDNCQTRCGGDCPGIKSPYTVKQEEDQNLRMQ